MNLPKLNKDEIQKLALSLMGVVFLLYVYFTFFLGPLARSRANTLVQINDIQSKLDGSKDEIQKAAKLEQTAKKAAARFESMKTFYPEGAPIAWFPPRIKAFFASQKIDKTSARLETTSGFSEPELSGWVRYNWLIDLPHTDYKELGHAIAELENSEPLLSISRLSIQASSEQPRFQSVNLAAANAIMEKK
jgi:hypothetical protein